MLHRSMMPPRGARCAPDFWQRRPRLRHVFNFSGSEIVFLLLIALIVLGPEKLPDAVRKFGKTYAEFKKVTSGFQSELKSALDEPMREMRETADALKKAASFDLDTDLGLKDLFIQGAASAESSPVVSAPEAVAPVAVGEEPPIEIVREPGPRFTSAAPVQPAWTSVVYPNTPAIVEPVVEPAVEPATVEPAAVEPVVAADTSSDETGVSGP